MAAGSVFRETEPGLLRTSVIDRLEDSHLEPFLHQSVIPVVLLHFDFPALGLSRCLGRHGIPVVALHPNGRSWLHRTRYAKVVASKELNLESSLETIARVSREPPVLIPMNDDAVRWLSQRVAQYQSKFRVAVCSPDAAEITVDKSKLARFCEENEIRVPQTLPLQVDDLPSSDVGLRFPAILKPLESSHWETHEARRLVGARKVVQVANREELDQWLNLFRALGKDVLFQEAIPGPDCSLLYAVGYVSRDDDVAGFFVGSKLRTYPPHFGRGSYVESVSEPDVDRLARKVVRAMGYRGAPIGIEFKRDARDGSLALIEINPRFGLWDAFATDCGMDIAYAMYADQTGLEYRASTSYGIGKRMLNVELDIPASVAYWRAGELRLGDWLKSIVTQHHSGIFARDDAATFWAYLRLLARRAARALKNLVTP